MRRGKELSRKDRKESREWGMIMQEVEMLKSRFRCKTPRRKKWNMAQDKEERERINEKKESSS